MKNEGIAVSEATGPGTKEGDEDWEQQKEKEKRELKKEREKRKGKQWWREARESAAFKKMSLKGSVSINSAWLITLGAFLWPCAILLHYRLL